jgi:Flp pilus assembly protein TadD
MVVGLTLTVALPSFVLAQGSQTTTLWGDVKVDETNADKQRPLSLMLVLYNLGGVVIDRTTVVAGGRYRFSVRPGEYDIGIEIETAEVARVHVILSGVPGADFRQDLALAYTAGTTGAKPKAATISAGDAYKRLSENEATFKRAQSAVDVKKYDDAANLFLQVVTKDPQDFQAWTELGTAYLLQKKNQDAENAYKKAIEVRPEFALASYNLGRVRVLDKKYEEAIAPLTKVTELQTTNAEAFYLLGEAYLQTKKGSKAVVYLTEAAKLGQLDAHLRLATLYNAVGMKDKAVAEYEEYLKKKPDSPEKAKLEQYIQANKPKP